MPKPLKLTPALKNALWAGKRLSEIYGKGKPGESISESWELSCHPSGSSLLADGSPLLGYIREKGWAELVGSRAANFSDFPVLVKLIDTAQNLSLQVHPGDEYAAVHENSAGKSELWYVLACEPGAGLYIGFSQDITPEQLRACVEDGTLESKLNFIPVQPGQAYYIPAGMVHAIGAGILLAEVQQSSDATYRLYDYNRRDSAGQLRPLHLEKALAVADLKAGHAETIVAQYNQCDGYALAQVHTCPYFSLAAAKVESAMPLTVTPESFVGLLCTSGSLSLSYEEGSLPISAGQTLFLPAGMGQLMLHGQGEVLLVSL